MNDGSDEGEVIWNADNNCIKCGSPWVPEEYVCESVYCMPPIIHVSIEEYEELNQLLKQPPRDLPGLRKLMKRSAPWED